MRTLKGSSSYLKNQVRKNLAKAILFFVLFVLILFVSLFGVLVTLRLSFLNEVGLLISLVSFGLSYYYLVQYRRYSGGWQGEKQVSSLLKRTLSDDYLLINDLYLGEGGDVDHVVLGPSGIFVLETKNWSGQIICNGDDWQRPGRKGFKASPSLQVKRNSARIKRIIDTSGVFGSMGVLVEGIVVFTNSRANLRVSNPTVLILKLPQLANHIAIFKNQKPIAMQQREAAAEELLKQRS